MAPELGALCRVLAQKMVSDKLVNGLGRKQAGTHCTKDVVVTIGDVVDGPNSYSIIRQVRQSHGSICCS